MSSELESVDLPAELLDETREAVHRGVVDGVADYVAEAVRGRLVKDRALAQVSELFGGPPPAEVLATVRRPLGLRRGPGDDRDRGQHRAAGALGPLVRAGYQLGVDVLLGLRLTELVVPGR